MSDKREGSVKNTDSSLFPLYLTWLRSKSRERANQKNKLPLCHCVLYTSIRTRAIAWMPMSSTVERH